MNMNNNTCSVNQLFNFLKFYSVLKYLRNVSWSLAIGFQLKKNDVLLLDNELVQHGRSVCTFKSHWTNKL